MSDVTDRVTARTALLEFIQADRQPTLDTSTSVNGEVDRILDRNKRVSTWAPGRAYKVGDTVHPTTRNGHRYRCITSGVSDSTTQTSVQYVTVTNGGTGYTSAPTVAFTGGSGSGVAGFALTDGSQVIGVILTNKGTGYVSAPTIAFTGVGAGAAGTAVIAALEPVWPKRRAGIIRETVQNPDGTTLVWQEYGPQFENIYDVRQSAHECWQLKAAKASEFITIGKTEFVRVYDNCNREAMKYAPIWFA